ncbi:hypothetical protein AN216_22810 [Streptomyces oceani]|uniref:Uncharacterized protein n=2 Tax=Streptomyces oceani TaxID=1075402 RepID=A0A1E7JWE7_9ACTN|nr:hypothetical protein AN216_22810 [Streptomyces oceani]
MMPVETPRKLPTSSDTTADVEALLNPAEADGTFRDTAECKGGGTLLGLLLLSSPTPRPKKG